MKTKRSPLLWMLAALLLLGISLNLNSTKQPPHVADILDQVSRLPEGPNVGHAEWSPLPEILIRETDWVISDNLYVFILIDDTRSGADIRWNLLSFPQQETDGTLTVHCLLGKNLDDNIDVMSVTRCDLSRERVRLIDQFFMQADGENASPLLPKEKTRVREEEQKKLGEMLEFFQKNLPENTTL